MCPRLGPGQWFGQLVTLAPYPLQQRECEDAMETVGTLHMKMNMSPVSGADSGQGKPSWPTSPSPLCLWSRWQSLADSGYFPAAVLMTSKLEEGASLLSLQEAPPRASVPLGLACSLVPTPTPVCWTSPFPGLPFLCLSV